MNEKVSYYRKLSLVGVVIFIFLVIIQVFWLQKALSLDQAEHRLTLKQMVPDIALKVNGLNHKAFHNEDELLQNIDINAVNDIVQGYCKKMKINGTVAFAIFQKNDETLLTNAPDLKQELKKSPSSVCMSCIISFSMSKASPQKEGESDEAFYERLQELTTFQYYSPVENLKSPQDQTVFFSIYHEKNIWESIGSLWYLFVGGILLNTILLLLFRYLIKSLTNYKQITQVKDDFFNNMTHEFKTPLSSIILASRLLKNNPHAENSENYVQLIEKESLFLENQIDRLLELSLLDNREIEINRSEILLSDIFEKVKKRMMPLIQDQKADLSVSMETEHKTINADLVHLTNCFCNLIENSLKYSAFGILIQIVVKFQNGKYVISVIDNGSGIDRVHHNKIFDRFYRGQQGNEYKTKGFGIGLSYVKNIIESHEGTIELNTAAQTGTEFIIVI